MTGGRGHTARGGLAAAAAGHLQHATLFVPVSSAPATAADASCCSCSLFLSLAPPPSLCSHPICKRSSLSLSLINSLSLPLPLQRKNDERIAAVEAKLGEAGKGGVSEAEVQKKIDEVGGTGRLGGTG